MNVVVAGNMLTKFYHFAIGRGLLKHPSIKITVLTFLVKKRSMKLSGLIFLEPGNTQRNFKVIP